MRARRVLAWLAVALSPSACVDLFHATDFVTLCERAPDDPACGAEAGAPEAATATDAGAVRPPLDFCTLSPADVRDRATRACAWLGACGGPLGDNVVGPCMLQALFAYDCELNPSLRPNGATHALWECLGEVQSCDDVERCVFGGPRQDCKAVTQGSFSTCATGDAAELRVQCGRTKDGPPTGVEPCVLSGRGCSKIDDSTSACTGARGTACVLGALCEGTAAVDCRSVSGKTLDRGHDCAAFGAGKCADSSAGPACAPVDDAPSCVTLKGATVTCDGDVATSCVDGKRVAIDCARLDLPCDVSGDVPTYDPLAACVERDASGACAVSAADDCVAGKVRSCAQGAAFEIDCESVGLGPCEKVSGGVLARCTPP